MSEGGRLVGRLAAAGGHQVGGPGALRAAVDQLLDATDAGVVVDGLRLAGVDDDQALEGVQAGDVAVDGDVREDRSGIDVDRGVGPIFRPVRRLHGA